MALALRSLASILGVLDPPPSCSPSRRPRRRSGIISIGRRAEDGRGLGSDIMGRVGSGEARDEQQLMHWSGRLAGRQGVEGRRGASCWPASCGQLLLPPAGREGGGSAASQHGQQDKGILRVRGGVATNDGRGIPHALVRHSLGPSHFCFRTDCGDLPPVVLPCDPDFENCTTCSAAGDPRSTPPRHALAREAARGSRVWARLKPGHRRQRAARPVCSRLLRLRKKTCHSDLHFACRSPHLPAAQGPRSRPKVAYGK